MLQILAIYEPRTFKGLAEVAKRTDVSKTWNRVLANKELRNKYKHSFPKKENSINFTNLPDAVKKLHQ